MPQSLIILGTGGNAYDVLDVVEAINADGVQWSVAGFLDDSRPAGTAHAGFPVLAPLREAARFTGPVFVNAIGSDQSFRRRAALVASTGLPPERFVTLIHPTACVSRRARLGRGVCVNPGVTIAGAVTIGDHVSLGPGCIVGHDAVIGEYAMLAPGAVLSGFVRVGRSCYIGARAVVRQHLHVGEEALVGMGAVVVRDVEAGSTVVGNPARPLVK
jgi:sugar O-acyltransferase (sialic acid O-acetyltransferase NeuD family)